MSSALKQPQKIGTADCRRDERHKHRESDFSSSGNHELRRRIIIEVLLPPARVNGVIVGVDGSVLLWDVRDLGQKEHKSLRVNLEFDHASHVFWTPDSKAFLVHTVKENHIVAYKIERKKDGTIGAAAPAATLERVRHSIMKRIDTTAGIVTRATEMERLCATVLSFWHTFYQQFL